MCLRPSLEHLSVQLWGLGGATRYIESLKMKIFVDNDPWRGHIGSLFGSFTSYRFYVTQVCQIWVSFPLLSVQSRIYWYVSVCGVHFHGCVSICVKGGLKQTYDSANFGEILSFKNRINVWMSVLSRSVQSRPLWWQHWHVVWQHWPLLTLSSTLLALLLILKD